jgi:ATP-dependent helicase HrpA
MYNSEQRVYLGARQTRFALHPSSTLAKKPPAWLMAFELVETSQLFARMAAKIEPLWLDQIGSHLLKRSYSDPHWSEKSARASVREHATLFGLPVLKDRSVDYASISPVLARKMFIEHALVRGEFHSRGLFQDKNRQRFDEIAALRDKARQSDMLADDERLFAFFDERVPETVVNGKTFEAWREPAEKSNPELLWLSYEDILAEDMRLQRGDYPDRVGVQGVELEATYCFDPAAADDGVTLHVPLTLLPQLDTGVLDYTIPAWHKTKIAALLNELPRALKRDLGPISALVENLAPKLSSRCGPLLPALSRAVLETTAVRIPEEAFRPDAIPAYLHFNCRIVGERGAVVAEGRDVAWLVKTHAPIARELLRRALPPSEWQRSGIVQWDFGDLPDFVSRTVQGTLLRSFPCTVDRETSVSLALLESEGAAEIAHRGGLRRLIALQVKGALADFAKRAPAPLTRRGTFPPSRSEREAFSNQLISCVLDNAFGLDQKAPLPRSKATFDALLASGTPKLKPTFEQTVRALSQIAVEYERVQLAIENASKQPSGSNVAIEVREQLEHLLPGDWLGTTPLSRIPHVPRYLVAAQSRLQRAVQDPRKDAGKAVPLVPLWKLFLAKKASARDREQVDQIRWTIEELRIALFAPELKPAQPVTIAGLKSALECLR